jgi:hypothetical protein
VAEGRAAHALLPLPDGFGATVRGLPADRPEKLSLRALDSAGRLLARQEATLPVGATELPVALTLPTELRNRVARLDLEGERGAGSALLLDERWRRRPVGLAGGGGEEGGAPLLDRLYYVSRALAPTAELRTGELAELLAQPPAVLVLADVPAVSGATAATLDQWLRQGGVLVRFAGPLLAHAAAGGPIGGPGEDRFLPVRLRDGGRTLGGAMSWTTPMSLAPFPESSPFAGLTAPDDVKVTAQVLAEPELDLASRTWARLSDGTPLVTAEKRDKGWLVLVHTTANAEWSNLALSGLFPDMLRRLVALAQGMPGQAAGPLPPAELLDGFGRLVQPSGVAAALGKDDRPGPRHPPGFYGDGTARVAFNLGPALAKPARFEVPRGATLTRLGAQPLERDLRAPLLAIALALAVLDLLVSLGLRGLLGRATAAAILLAACGPVRAADSFALDAGLATRLAYVKTGDAALDRKSRQGLLGLTQIIGSRSTAQLDAPMAVDLERDPVLFFPLLYWPVSAGQKPLSAEAAARLDGYMRRGGLVVLDTGAQAEPGTPPPLQAVLGGLALPPLAPVGGEHVLTRSFYLLKEFPGRYDGGQVWVEQGGATANDGVSPVVVGGNDWAGAWAVDEAGRPLFAAVPGGERQREMAYRFGVNLVMYALTGNYKADQVHLPAILDRLGK